MPTQQQQLMQQLVELTEAVKELAAPTAGIRRSNSPGGRRSSSTSRSIEPAPVTDADRVRQRVAFSYQALGTLTGRVSTATGREFDVPVVPGRPRRQRDRLRGPAARRELGRTRDRRKGRAAADPPHPRRRRQRRSVRRRPPAIRPREGLPQAVRASEPIGLDGVPAHGARSADRLSGSDWPRSGPPSPSSRPNSPSPEKRSQSCFSALPNCSKPRAAPANDVLLVHPLQLSRWLDEAWASAPHGPRVADRLRPRPQAPFLGDAGIVDVLDLPAQSAPPALLAPSGIAAAGRRAGSPGVREQSTRRRSRAAVAPPDLRLPDRVHRRLRGDGRGGAPAGRRRDARHPVAPTARSWVRATEELFFRDPPLFSITGIASEARPRPRVTRRNAYWRMFGIDLPHPLPARWPRPAAPSAGWKADVGGGVNTDFREKWTELLRQVWLGIENARNTSGRNATDREYVAFLCQSHQGHAEHAPARRAAGPRGVRARHDAELVPPDPGDRHADRAGPQGGGDQPGRPAGADRAAGRHGPGRAVARAVRAGRPDVQRCCGRSSSGCSTIRPPRGRPLFDGDHRAGAQT